MAKPKVTGVWHGRYWYDPREDGGDALPNTAFRMRLKQSWLLGSFQGEVWEEPPYGATEKGYIEGRITEDGVFFLKRMPVYYVWFGGRTVPLKEHLLARSGLTLDTHPPHPPIKYSGTYSSERDELEGVWEFAPVAVNLLSQGHVLPYGPVKCSGKWMAQRAQD